MSIQSNSRPWIVQSQKIAPPRSTWVLSRPRLTSELTQTRGKKLVLILGQAAQGKSTLAAEYVGSLSEPFAWLNLDPGDSDPINLFLWIIRALQSADPDTDFSLAMAMPSSALGPRAPGPMFREWAGAVMPLIRRPMQFVLDGLDRLDPEGAAFELLPMMIEESPEDFRWLALSRSRPPLEIKRMEMNRTASVIGNEALAFTTEEARTLGKRLYKFHFKAEQIRMLVEFTEGWAGGLIMMLESLLQYQSPQNGLDLFSKEAGRLKGRIFNYFAEQVFDRLPEGTRAVLAAASILDTIKPHMVETLTGASEPEKWLQDLVDRNFFVTNHYDPAHGWTFRYHQLFKEFLQSKFESSLGPADRRRLLIRAAELYAHQNEPDLAMGLFLKAEAWARAADLLQNLGLRLFMEGRIGDLSRWISALPQGMVEADPWLTTYRCATQRYTAAGRNIPEFARAAAQFKKLGNLQGRLMALAFLIEALTANGLYQPETIQESLDLLESISPDVYPFERGSLWHHIGFAETLRGDFRLAYHACLNAITLARRINNDHLLVNALVNSVTIFVFIGKFNQLDKVCLELDQMLSRIDNREMTCLYRAALTLALTFRGDLNEGLALAEQNLADIHKSGLFYLQHPAMLYHVISLVNLDRVEEAAQAALAALAFTRATKNDFLETVTYLFWGIGLYRVEQLEEAESKLQKALDNFRSGRVQAPNHESAGTLIMNLVRLAQGRPPDIQELKRVRDHFSRSGSLLLTTDCSLSLTLALESLNRLEEARDCLAKALELTAQKGYDYFFLLSPRDAARACCLALTWGMNDVVDEASRLLCGRLSIKAPALLRPLLKHKKAWVRERARFVLHQIRRRGLPQIRIQTLGPFTVWRGDVPLTEDDWAGGMPRMLLKAVIALGPRRASRETITAALWPEAPTEAAEGNLKTALHRLRRALEPDLDPALGSAYISLKDNILTLTEGVVEIDLESFDSQARKAREAAAREKPVKAIAAYETAVNTYIGPFLEDDGFAEWAMPFRNNLCRQFIELQLEKAKLHDHLGHFRKAAACYDRILDTDPNHEETVRRLMSLFSAHGRQNEAIKAFRRLRQSLLNGLGEEPEALTWSIYNKIQEEKP